MIPLHRSSSSPISSSHTPSTRYILERYLLLCCATVDTVIFIFLRLIKFASCPFHQQLLQNGLHGLRERERHSLRGYATLITFQHLSQICLTQKLDTDSCLRRVDEAPRYERDRSASPRPTRRESPRGGPRRSASPNGNGHSDSRSVPFNIKSQHFLTYDSGPPKNDRDSRGPPQDDGAVNPGSNLFVTGIHPRLSEQEVTRLFEKYGDVEKCQIMLDPHTKESRGFGFVKMVTAEQADAAKEGLQGEVIEGRTLSIEKARRSRPRTPTPGKYFGPPKRGKQSLTL